MKSSPRPHLPRLPPLVIIQPPTASGGAAFTRSHLNPVAPVKLATGFYLGSKQRQERKRTWRRCCLAGQPAQGSAYGHPPPSRCRALVANFFWFDILTDNAVLSQNDAMSTAAAIVSVRAAQPDPTRAWARASATLNAIALLINLVFNLIRHGKNLAVAFYDRGREPGDTLTGGFLATVN